MDGEETRRTVSLSLTHARTHTQSGSGTPENASLLPPAIDC